MKVFSFDLIHIFVFFFVVVNRCHREEKKKQNKKLTRISHQRLVG